MTLVTSFTVGSLRCHLLEGGTQRLDGGAMFGVVPKPLWEKRITPDARNRIPLALRCLLVEHSDGLALVDTGIGNKETGKFKDIYGIENDGSNDSTQLEDALREAGFDVADVRWLINTHLHFDHAGGNTKAEGGGRQQKAAEAVQLVFPNATYVVQRGELEFARRANERTRASYFPANFDPVAEADRWRLLDGPTDIIPGISALPTPGHVPYHQSIMIRDGGETALFLGDLAPTAAHLPLPWIMGYDLEPLTTLETKRNILGQAAAEGWLLLFEHDPEVLLGRVVEGSRGLELADELRLTG
jgi:glyoxylase-like metal-dependent hydrolase (beta-lactamase superfamily II)